MPGGHLRFELQIRDLATRAIEHVGHRVRAPPAVEVCVIELPARSGKDRKGILPLAVRSFTPTPSH
jgi:hypothetical protein